MIYDLSNPYEVEAFRAKAEQMIDRKAACELKACRPQRTTNQNSYLHLLLGYFASETGYTLDEVKVDIFKRLCNKILFEEEITNRRGQTVKRLRSSASLSTEEMATAIDRFKNYSASVCGIYLPSSEDHRALLYAQKQVDSYRQFV